MRANVAAPAIRYSQIWFGDKPRAYPSGREALVIGWSGRAIDERSYYQPSLCRNTPSPSAAPRGYEAYQACLDLPIESFEDALLVENLGDILSYGEVLGIFS